MPEEGKSLQKKAAHKQHSIILPVWSINNDVEKKMVMLLEADGGNKSLSLLFFEVNVLVVCFLPIKHFIIMKENPLLCLRNLWRL